jgi:transcriptional regulator with XRE-family HTH domain
MGAQQDFNQPPRIRLYFREWREWAGLSQDELASKIGESAETVARNEKGKRVHIRISYLEKFVHAIGCPNPWDPIAGPPGTLPPTFQILRNLNRQNQEHAHRILETFLYRGP